MSRQCDSNVCLLGFTKQRLENKGNVEPQPYAESQSVIRPELLPLEESHLCTWKKKIVRFRIWRTASSLRLCLVYKVQIYFLKVNDIWIVIPNKSHYHGVKNNRSYFGDQIWWCSFVVPQSGGRGREIYSSRPACLKTKTKAERSCVGRRGGRPWHKRLGGVSHVFF